MKAREKMEKEYIIRGDFIKNKTTAVLVKLEAKQISDGGTVSFVNLPVRSSFCLKL